MGFARQLTGVLAAGAAALAVPTVALAEDEKNKQVEQALKTMFDPEALERGAKALREINKSPNAKQVLELTRQQELVKLQESKEREADFKRQAAMFSKEQEAVRWEEQRKTMAEEGNRQAQLAQYQDELARKRLGQEHELQRQRNAEMVTLQEQSAVKREQERLRVEQQIQAERRAAEQYAAELAKQVEREKAIAEAKGRILEQRENEDVHRRAAILKYQEETKKALESINAVMSHLGTAAVELISDKQKLATAVAGFTALALGLYGAREGSRVVANAVDRWLGTPRLVRETSRTSPFSLKNLVSKPKTAEEVKRDFSDVVLPGGLHNQVRSLAAVTANTKRHGAPFRHMLFYGPPGTGKTMAAKRLARTSGLDYAIMSGGDVAPLAGGAVTQLHQTFDWAERSRKGLLLFIDEADAFLGKRHGAMSEGLRGALNAMLFRTGDQSRDFLVVLATNRPGDLDDAVLDRMDEALEFPLPSAAERKKLLDLYLDKYITKAGTAEGGAGAASGAGLKQRIDNFLRGRKQSVDRITVAGVDEQLVQRAAELMEGFSGREIAKFMASVQAAVYGSHEAQLTPEVWQSVLQHKLREHRQREAFREGHHSAEGGGRSGSS